MEVVIKHHSVSAYGVASHDSSNDGYSGVIPGEGSRAHPFTGCVCGKFLSPDGPRRRTTAKRGGGSMPLVQVPRASRPQPGRSRAEPFSKHSRKRVRLRSLNKMSSAHSMYPLRITNEIQNGRYPCRTLNKPQAATQGTVRIPTLPVGNNFCGTAADASVTSHWCGFPISSGG